MNNVMNNTMMIHMTFKNQIICIQRKQNTQRNKKINMIKNVVFAKYYYVLKLNK